MPPPSPFTVESAPPLHVVRFTLSWFGDSDQCELLSLALRTAIERHDKPNLVFILTDMAYISSTMLGVIASLWPLVRKREGKIHLVGVEKNLLEMLKLMRVTEFVKIHAALQDIQPT